MGLHGVQLRVNHQKLLGKPIMHWSRYRKGLSNFWHKQKRNLSYSNIKYAVNSLLNVALVTDSYSTGQRGTQTARFYTFRLQTVGDI